jgi:hypothetical protein
MRPTSSRSRPEDSPEAEGQAGPRRSSLRRLGRRLRGRFLRFTAGGRWTYQLRPSVRRNLRWFWLVNCRP